MVYILCFNKLEMGLARYFFDRVLLVRRRAILSEFDGIFRRIDGFRVEILVFTVFQSSIIFPSAVSLCSIVCSRL